MAGAPAPSVPAPRRTGIVNGLLLALLLAVAAQLLASLIGSFAFGFSKTPVSPVLLAILFGLVVRNSVGLPASCEAGVRFAIDRVLKVGVALLGFRLSLGAVGDIGLAALPIVAGCIGTALVVVRLMSQRLGLSGGLGTLIGVGTSICGCTAIMTVAPVIRARQTEVCYAVTCVALFGTVGMLAYPFVAQALFADSPQLAGMFLGTAIHDTAQVVGAGMLHEQYFGTSAGLEAATVTKLVRNLSLLIVIPALGMLAARQAGSAAGRVSLPQLVPLFIVGFLAMSGLRTLGDIGPAAFGLLPATTWQAGIDAVAQLSGLLLAVAMAGVGLATDFSDLRRIGFRPLAMGFAAAAIVGLVSVALIVLLA